MEPKETVSLDSIDLSDPEFWKRGWSEREAAFRTLRRERPMAFFAENDFGLDVPKGEGYWAVTKYADIREASHNAKLFSSAQGATSIPDLPPEFLEFFGGMINMDDPRHGRQRR